MLAMAFSAVAALSIHNETKVENVEALSGDVTLYINHFDGGGTWNNFSYYLFGGSKGEIASWPGLPFTDSMKTQTPDQYGHYAYKLSFNTSEYSTLVLVGNPNSWGGSQAQTENLVLSDFTNNGLYCGNQIPNTNKFDVGHFAYETKTVYMLDLKGDVYQTNHYCHAFVSQDNPTGTTWPGVQMTKVAGQNNLYSAEINADLGSVVFNNNGVHQTDDIHNVSNGDAYVAYPSPDRGYNKLTLDAASFIDKYMKFETRWTNVIGTGECKSNGWYSSAKTAFNSKTSAEKTAILTHEPTKVRFANWAAANGDSLNQTTGVITSLSKAIISPISSISNSSATVVVIIVTLVSVTSIGAYVYLRRRKEH